MISLSKLRAELRLPVTDEEALADLRTAVIDQWEEATGRPWAAREDYVETFCTPGDASVLFLGLTPVTAMVKVEERDLDDSTWEELDATDYVADGHRLERLGAYWARRVRVTYDGGYTETTCPGDIRAALAVQAKFMLARHANGMVAIKSNTGEGGSGVYEDADVHPYFRRVAMGRRRKV